MVRVAATPLSILLVMVVCGGLFDLRTRRIPNWMTMPGLALGLALNGFSRDGGWQFGFLGMLIALAVYIPLYLVRAMGAGDVKLMAAVGAFAGPENWIGIFLATAIVGGAAALVLVVMRGRYYETFFNVSILVTDLLHFRAPYQTNYALDVRNPNALRLPHGVSIALGTMLAFVCAHFRFI